MFWFLDKFNTSIMAGKWPKVGFTDKLSDFKPKFHEKYSAKFSPKVTVLIAGKTAYQLL
jgi:hypothetical protein